MVVVQNVGSIRDAVRDVVSFNGSRDASYLLISKAILCGAKTSALAEPFYGKGSMRSMRKEAVFIEQSLSAAVRRIQTEDPGEMTASLLTVSKLDTILSDPAVLRGSNLIPIIGTWLTPLKPDYRMDRLIVFGEKATSELRVTANRYRTPVNVDLNALDNGDPLPGIVKRLYQEYKTLEDVALRYKL